MDRADVDLPGERSERAPAIATALVVAASLVGDTLLYTVLPVSASRLGISRPAVGVILSANRWVRLFTNPLAARLYERFPAGALVVAGLAIGALSTATYALPTALALFVAGRLLWGFSYSLLRLGSFLAAIDEAPRHAGRMIGNTRAIWGIGYFAGAIYAPFAVEAIGWGGACLVAAGITILAGVGPAAIVAAWRRGVRFVDEAIVPASVWEPRLMALFIAASLQLAIYAGIVVAAGGFRVDELFDEGAPVFSVLVPATFIAAAFLITQRIAQVAWTPIAGRFADRSAQLAFGVSTALSCACIAALALPLDASAFVVLGASAFVNGLTATIAVEYVVARRTSPPDRPRILAALHTWQDFGAAAGALAGGVLAATGASPALVLGAAMSAFTVPLWIVGVRASDRVPVTA
jgi:MFS family permease